ncbi:MAG: protein jag [Clostridiales bacterium]|nr:protein jag [Clostridiales bacterium]
MDFIEVTAKTVEDAVTDALVQLGVTSDQLEYEVIEKGSTGFLGFNSKPAIIKARKKYTSEDYIREFLEKVFDAMDMKVEIIITASEEENVFDVELKGDNMGVLIGKRGQTLDSLQYLTNLAINKNLDTYIKVKLDTEDYRKRRQETLENLAKNIAYKVKRSSKPVALAPMNPFERRVIHSALQNDRYVTTHSEGENPYRHVVVTPKKDERYNKDSRYHKDSRYRKDSRYGKKQDAEE